MTRHETVQSENDDCERRSPFERLTGKFGHDVGLALRSGLLVRVVFSNAADGVRKAIRRGTRAEKTLTKAFYILLEFIGGALWFLLYAIALLFSPGSAEITSQDYSDEQTHEE